MITTRNNINIQSVLEELRMQCFSKFFGIFYLFMTLRRIGARL